MADYFLGIWAGRPKPFQFTENQKRMFNLTSTEGEADRKVPAQPIIFTTNNALSTAETSPIRYNLRKLSELPFQLIRAQREEDLYNHVLFNYDFTHAKLSCMPLNLCIFDYESALEYVFDKEVSKIISSVELDNDFYFQVKLMSDALRLSSSVLAADPNNLSIQIIGRLLPFYTTCRKIATFIDQCESTGLQVMALVPAFNTLASPGGPLVYSLEAHQFAVYGLEVVSAGQHLLTVSNKFIVFDLSSGDIVRIIDPKIEGIMTFLSLAPDQRYCVTTTISNQYIICNLLTGEFILRDYQPPSNNNQQQTTGKTTGKTSTGQPLDPLLGAAVSNAHFAIWSAKMYQVYTNKGMRDIILR
jgi:WD40 repeat protein